MDRSYFAARMGGVKVDCAVCKVEHPANTVRWVVLINFFLPQNCVIDSNFHALCGEAL